VRKSRELQPGVPHQSISGTAHCRSAEIVEKAGPEKDSKP